MFSRVRIAIRFFFVGLAVGVLLAPRSGEATRRMIREKADRLLNEILDAATLGTAGGNGGEVPEEEAKAPRSRSSNGRGGGRSTRSSSASESETETAGAGASEG